MINPVTDTASRVPATTIATLLKQPVRPVFLLGAGASVRSGIPVASSLVNEIARWGYCKLHDRIIDDPTLMRSDWWSWFASHSWFNSAIPLGAMYPRAVDEILRPKERRREFFRRILSPQIQPSEGYIALAQLLARNWIRTVLTTNFDNIIATQARSVPDVHHVEEIKTGDDHPLFSTNPRYAQIVYLHGSVDHYTDKNIEEETVRLDQALVSLLHPLLRDHPIVIVGYRGGEASIMRHLLLEQKEKCNGFHHGIYWCERNSALVEDREAMVGELSVALGRNFQFVGIDGFDELMTLLMQSTENVVSVHANEMPTFSPPDALKTFDLRPAKGCDFAALNQHLLSVKLAAYYDAATLTRPDHISEQWIQIAAAERSITESSKSNIPTQAGILLFGRAPQNILQQGRIEVLLEGEPGWISEILGDGHAVGGGAERVSLKGDLWAQLDQALELLSRVNRPFRLKASTSKDVLPYPGLALKELLTNMVAHRDYEQTDPSELRITASSISFSNPGGLVEHVKRQLHDADMQDVISADRRGIKGYRNPVVADFFYAAGAMDKKGSGLPDVVSEAANNLNVVRFGPDEGNANFVATISCRPEAIDEATRTAKQQQKELRYSPNLLPIEKWPLEIWRMGTQADYKEIARAERAGAAPLCLVDGYIWSFSGPDEGPIPLRQLVISDETSMVPLATLLKNERVRFALPRLLNGALARHLTGIGMRVRFEAGGGLRAYFPANRGAPREITYRGMFKTATRTVAKPVVARASGKLLYWEHKAALFRFEQFDDTWALSILPAYVYTLDGESKFIQSEKIGALTTKRSSRDYNLSVLHDVVFWCRIISGGNEEALFPMSLALTNLETTDDERYAVSVEMASMVPTVVFQSSSDSLPPDDADVAISAEELQLIEEEIGVVAEHLREGEAPDA